MPKRSISLSSAMSRSHNAPTAPPTAADERRNERNFTLFISVLPFIYRTIAESFFTVFPFRIFSIHQRLYDKRDSRARIREFFQTESKRRAPTAALRMKYRFRPVRIRTLCPAKQKRACGQYGPQALLQSGFRPIILPI